MKTQISLSSFLILLFTGFMISSCNNGTKQTSKNDIQFDSINVEQTYHLLHNPDNPNCNLQINFTYPYKYANNEVLQKIRKQFIASCFGDTYQELMPKQAVELYTQDYLNAYKDLEDDFKSEMEKSKDQPMGAWFSYYEMLSNEIVYNHNDLLCYSVSMESYTGGAHGAHSHMNYILNLKTGDVVTEDDIFTENFQDSISLMIVDKIATQNKVENPKELENIGFFSTDEIFPNGNILVDSTGITYTFNEYEIAAYVVGAVNVHLPFDEIKHLLKKDSPVYLLAGNN